MAASLVQPRLPRTFACALAVGVIAIAAALAVPAGAAVTCTRALSPGADVQGAVNAGGVTCLHAGTYTQDVKVTAPSVTLTSYPGERATLVGRLYVAKGADFVTVSDLDLNGKNGPDLPSPTVTANDAKFIDNDVTNDHTEICFDVGNDVWGNAARTLIQGNRIHACGELPATNYDHGVYVSDATDTQILDNVIYDNADRGVQLYPDAQRTTIMRNVIDGNGEGVLFAGASDSASSGNTVKNNVITFSKLRYNVESYWGGPVGTGNLATNNCVYGGAQGNIGSQSGFTATGNLVVDPQYANRATGDYRIPAGNPCAALLSSGSTSTPPPTSDPVAAPSSLSAAAASSSRIDLTWRDNSGNETGFVLERDTSGAFTSPQVVRLASNTTSYADTGLPASTTYYYRVKAVNSTDSSAYSTTASASTQAAAITTPTGAGYSGTVLADNPVSYWRLGEAGGTVAADARGVNPGGYLNGPRLAAPSLLGSDTANTAVAFDGYNDSVRVPSSDSLRIGAPITLEAWIKPAALPAAGQFASVLTKAESYSLQFNGPRLEFTIIQNGTRRRLQAPSGAISVGQAYHVVGTYDGATRRLYVNGTQVASDSLTGGATLTTNPLYVGSWNGSGEMFRGTVDDVAVYRTALSAPRVGAHYGAGR
jgi:hypothetical protein